MSIIHNKVKEGQPDTLTNSGSATDAELEEAYIFPMSFAQRRMWFFYQLDPSNPAYNVPFALRFHGRIDPDIMERAINTIIERHEALRTTYRILDDQPVQVIFPALTIPLSRVDLTALPEEEKAAALQNRIAMEAQQPFDLQKGPAIRTVLFEVRAEEYVFLLNCHHIVVDGWALGVFHKELVALYNAYSVGKPSPLADLVIQYADFTQWQMQQLQGDFLQRLVNYWRSRLGGTLPTLNLPTDYPRPAQPRAGGARRFFVHPDHILAQLKELCQRQGVTLFMVLLAAYQTLLHRYTGQDDIILGSPIANRNRVELEGLIAFFANTLALRVDLSGDPTFLELLKRVQQTALEAYAHQDLPFERLVEEVQPERSPNQNPIFQHIFVLQSPPKVYDELRGVRTEMFEYENSIVKFDLELITWEGVRGLHGCFIYNKDLFSENTITRMIEHWFTLVEDIVTHPEKRLSEFTLMRQQERRFVLEERQPQPLDGEPRSIAWLFAQQVKNTPNAPAILYKTEKGEGCISFLDLGKRIDRLAGHLRTLHVGLDVPVAIFLRQSPELTVGVLAVLKAGGMCLPLDPEAPAAWLEQILADSQPAVLLTQRRDQLQLPQLPSSCTICYLDEEERWRDEGDESSVAIEGYSEHGAYILYSCGKGMLVSHALLQRQLHWLQATFQLSNRDRVGITAAPGTDVALWELLWPLSAGAAIVLPEHSVGEAGADHAIINELLFERDVTVLHATPEQLTTHGAEEEWQRSHSLRLLLCYGEGLTRGTLDTLTASFSGSFYALYGLPAAAAWIAVQDCRQWEEQDAILQAARPTHLTSYVLDSRLQPVPTGVFGEIFLAGDRFAEGYGHKAALMNDCVMQNPFMCEAKKDVKILRTGKYGRIHSDGTIEILKSLDRQVWYAGHYIGLSEIEVALCRDSSIDDCVVLVRKNEHEKREIVAYIVPRGPVSLDHLHVLLPPAMRPHAFVQLTSVPLTADGEINEHSLQAQAVLDEKLRTRWRARLEAFPTVERAAVLIDEEKEEIEWLHISDILPDWQRALRIAATPASLAPDVAPLSEQQIAQDELPFAVSYGPELVLADDAPETLPAALLRAASKAGAQKIIHVQFDGTEVCQTYTSLLAEAEQVLGGLRRLGLKPQDKVLFQLERTQDFVVAFWGCVLGGFVPVPLTIAPTYAQANSAVSKLQHAWKVLQHPVVIAGQALAAPICKMFDEAGLQETTVVSFDDLRSQAADKAYHISQPEDLVILLLTSGSTGMPKGVMLNHRNILCRSAATAQMNHFTQRDISLNWMPLDHVGGIVMYHVLDTYLCSRQVHVQTQAILENPLKWLDLIEQYRITSTWAPNFAYNLVNNLAEEIKQRTWNLSSLRFILNAGEAIVARTARRFLELLSKHSLPATAMHPCWGMSETSSGVTFSQHFTLENTSDDQSIVEVGAPIPGFAIRIVGSDNQPLREGSVGRLQVKGLSVTAGYYQNPQLNQEVFSADGWFETGDLGVIRAGNLAITGRAKDVIIINGINIPCHDVEAVVEEVRGVDVSYTAASAVRDLQGDTDKLAVFFVPTFQEKEQRIDLLKEVRSQVVRKIGANVDYLVPVAREDIPKTAIGKIQRAQLRERLQKGEFDQILKEVDLLLQQKNTLPAWFYRKHWHRKKGLGNIADIQRGCYLLFLDQHGIGSQLACALEHLGSHCIGVEAGADFALLSPGRYCIDPHEPEQYQRLIDTIQDGQEPIDGVIHLWTTQGQPEDYQHLEALREAQFRGSYSILFVMQALLKNHPIAHPIRLYAVHTYMQAILPEDENNTAAATLAALLQTIPLEHPWVRCCSIDLDRTAQEQQVARILYEIAQNSDNQEVAYRGGKRLVPSLEQVKMVREVEPAVSFKEGGLYFVTGGLGGIGTYLITYLLQHYHARVVAIGKTPLSHLAHSEASEQDEVLKLRMKHYQALKAVDGDFIYEAVDVGDLEAVQRVVSSAEKRWNRPLDGILHLAGEGNLASHWQAADSHRIAGETIERFENMFQAKLYGTWVLSQLLKTRPQTIFLTFSSINGLFGGASFSAYSAANSFLDSYTCYLRQQVHRLTYCIHWSIWHNIGMSQDNPAYATDAARSLGYFSISKEQGLASLLAVLAGEPDSIIIGLDGSNAHILRYLRTRARAAQHLYAYFTAKGEPPSAEKLRALVVKDRFGTSSTARLLHVASLPFTQEGEVDVAKLREMVQRKRSGQSSAQESDLPVTELERIIASIWQEVLNVDTIGVHDNFFSLGGHSLRMSQVHSKLRSALKRELSLVDLFRYPTIALLAQHFTENVPLQTPVEESHARAEMRKDLSKRRREQRIQREQ